MAVTLAAFRADFGEFDEMLDAVVQAKIDAAEARISRTVLDAGDVPKGDEVVKYRTAASLRRVQGEHAVGPAEEYDAIANRLGSSAAAAYRVI